MPTSDADGTTHGVWFGPEDAKLPGQFKKVFKFRRDPFSMSGEIRHAMRMHIAVQETLNQEGLGRIRAFWGENRAASKKAEFEKREFVRDAIREKAGRERERWGGGEAEADSNSESEAETETGMDKVETDHAIPIAEPSNRE